MTEFGEVKRQVYNHIRNNPGLTVAQIARNLSIDRKRIRTAVNYLFDKDECLNKLPELPDQRGVRWSVKEPDKIKPRQIITARWRSCELGFLECLL
jgi:hypothetical protein